MSLFTRPGTVKRGTVGSDSWDGAPAPVFPRGFWDERLNARSKRLGREGGVLRVNSAELAAFPHGWGQQSCVAGTPQPGCTQCHKRR